MFIPKSTKTIASDEPTKTLLYAHHGFGKTYQCGNYERRFGRGFIISGESGLKSLAGMDIDYLPFSSWDGKHDPSLDIYSFKGIAKTVGSPEFRKFGYSWIAIDSLTEMSDLLMAAVEEEVSRETKPGKEMNGFDVWSRYGNRLIGALKWVRDLPFHVLVTCLAKEEEDANGVTQFWPMVKGKGVGKQIPGLFDHVLCGVRLTETTASGEPRIKRFVITEETSGWHGKVRDPLGKVKPFEDGNDITELLARMMDKSAPGKQADGEGR